MHLISLPALPLRWIALLAAAMLLAAPGCRRREIPAAARTAPAPTAADFGRYASAPVGAAVEGKPWITHVNVTDLDQDGRPDILACDSQKNTVVWLRQDPAGSFTESVLAAELTAPVHVSAIDMDGDRDLDLLIACMGQVFPNNEKIGTVVILENDGAQGFTKHAILDQVARVTDVQAGDFNGDGRLDLAVAMFGYYQGEIRWLENTGSWRFRSHDLLSLPGTINVCIADMNGNGPPDIVALVSQQYENVYLFDNDGAGNFTQKVIFGSTNEDFGSSGISLCDLNRDGKPDVLYTNGDGFDYADPGSRPWHGVQWLENLGAGLFRYHHIGALPGAYSPVGVDLNADGAMDVVAVSGFNDWKNPQAASLVVFQNDGRMNFAPHILAHAPTHLVSVAAARLDGKDQPPVLVTGGFHAYPPWDRMSRILVWRRQ